MNLKELLIEYGLEIDDVRWYLSADMTARLIAMKDEPEEMTRFIWSGRLEGELYGMAERFIDELQDRLDRNLTDEGLIRTMISEIVAKKRERNRRR